MTKDEKALFETWRQDVIYHERQIIKHTVYRDRARAKMFFLKNKEALMEVYPDVAERVFKK